MGTRRRVSQDVNHMVLVSLGWFSSFTTQLSNYCFCFYFLVLGRWRHLWAVLVVVIVLCILVDFIIWKRVKGGTLFYVDHTLFWGELWLLELNFACICLKAGRNFRRRTRWVKSLKLSILTILFYLTGASVPLDLFSRWNSQAPLPTHPTLRAIFY